MIFIIEDDESIRELVCYTLKNRGFHVEGFDNSTPFFEALKKEIPELILLDIMLPGKDGISILNQLRQSPKTKKIPIIMLTAKGTEYDKVIALDSGADDYVTKPFGIVELVSRVKAVLRRVQNTQNISKFSFENVVLDDEEHSVSISGEAIELTLKEYNLLMILLKNKGKVMTRDILLQQIWGYDFDGETRTVDVHIRTLRTKLGEQSDIIETIRGVGYRIGSNIR